MHFYLSITHSLTPSFLHSLIPTDLCFTSLFPASILLIHSLPVLLSLTYSSLHSLTQSRVHLVTPTFPQLIHTSIISPSHSHSPTLLSLLFINSLTNSLNYLLSRSPTVPLTHRSHSSCLCLLPSFLPILPALHGSLSRVSALPTISTRYIGVLHYLLPSCLRGGDE